MLRAGTTRSIRAAEISSVAGLDNSMDISAKRLVEPHGKVSGCSQLTRNTETSSSSYLLRVSPSATKTAAQISHRESPDSTSNMDFRFHKTLIQWIAGGRAESERAHDTRDPTHAEHRSGLTPHNDSVHLTCRVL